MNPQNTHNLLIGYILLIFGFTGSHRFYYGRQITGTIYFFTLGLFFIGWIADIFLMPRLDRTADITYIKGPYDYNLFWVLLTFLGLLGVHRMMMGKWGTGLLYLISGGIFGLGYIYDFFTLNEQIDELNRTA
ncbi:MAG: TM2 domain-containing protein [Pseudobacteriovorax sp.]|nr:TM2 domain-containing protein [Pseudobacteriovorax sp.]